MLTKKQTVMYWRVWGSICAAQGWERNDNERRYSLHAHCRCPQSMRDFSNRDFSRFLSESAPFRDVVDIRDRDRENALHTIRKDAAAADLDEAYLRAICRDLYDTTAYEELPQAQLENFRNVIHNRARTHRSAQALSLHPSEPSSVNPF